MAKVTLWVPVGGESPKWPCVLSWLNMDYPDGERPVFLKGTNNAPRLSWNQSVRDFLAGPTEWLFSVHNDVSFAPGTLNRLLSWGKPIVSALIFMRTSPIIPHVWQQYNEQGRYAYRIEDTYNWFIDHVDAITFGPHIMEPRLDEALVPVTFTSTACTIIHRSVLEALPDPWFVCDDEYSGGGEDRRFYENAKMAGFQAYVDRSCIVGHLMDGVPSSPADFIVWHQSARFRETGEPGTDVGPPPELEGK